MEDKPNERKKLIAVGVIAASIVIVVIVGIVIAGLINGSGTRRTDTPSDGKTSEASELFYNSLANAAKQQKLRVAMYRATYATNADAESNQNVGTRSASVAEIDSDIGKSRSVYATNTSDASKYSYGRCLDGVTYVDNFFGSSDKRPVTLEEADEALKTNRRVFKSTVDGFSPCPKLGVLPGAVPDLASFRYSDGVFPVTLSEAQAENWKQKVKAANLFTIKDEGVSERNSQRLRKISITPKNEETVNRTLNDIFKEAGEIEKIQREQPRAEVQYEFISVGPINTGSVGGFYLIDETTKLPVYSELYNTNPDKEDKDRGRQNIARTKQTYAFGQPLSLTLESPLEIIK